MVQIAEAMAGVVDQLTAAGLRATVDARDVNPPCVLVRPPSVAYRFGKGGWDAEFAAWAIVPSAGANIDVKAAGRLLEDTQTALIGDVVSATPDDVTMPDGSTLPMYVMTWSTRIPCTPPNPATTNPSREESPHA